MTIDSDVHVLIEGYDSEPRMVEEPESVATDNDFLDLSNRGCDFEKNVALLDHVADIADSM